MPTRFLPAKLMLAFVDKDCGNFITGASRLGGARGGTRFSGRTFREENACAEGGDAFFRQDIVMILMGDEAQRVVASVVEGVAGNPDPMEGEAVIIDVPRALARPGFSCATTEGDTMKSGSMLIVSITNHGEAESLMQAARKAGARGGTIVNARGTGTEDDFKYFGITLVPEKEILIIVSEGAHADAILEELGSQPLFSEPGGGIIFAAEVERLITLKKR
jgi:nitrogen regulatory protein PII